jgi:hypothetical protein
MSDTPSINGWKPPVVYDPVTGNARIASQQDFDRLTMIAEAYKALLKKMRDATQDHETLKARVEGMPTDGVHHGY